MVDLYIGYNAVLSESQRETYEILISRLTRLIEVMPASSRHMNGNPRELLLELLTDMLCSAYLVGVSNGIAELEQARAHQQQ